MDDFDQKLLALLKREKEAPPRPTDKLQSLEDTKRSDEHKKMIKVVMEATKCLPGQFPKFWVAVSDILGTQQSSGWKEDVLVCLCKGHYADLQGTDCLSMVVAFHNAGEAEMTKRAKTGAYDIRKVFHQPGTKYLYPPMHSYKLEDGKMVADGILDDDDDDD